MVDASADEATKPVIAEALGTELQKHLGRWVAVFEDRVVGVGDTAKEATDAALAVHVTDPLVIRVPAYPERLNHGAVVGDGDDRMSQAEVVEAVRTIMSGGTGSKAGDGELVGRIMSSVPHPRTIGLIWSAGNTMSAEEIVESAYSDLPIEP
jgi:hypothetical protein